MSKNLRAILILFLVLLNVGCDQVSKEIARSKLDYHEVITVAGEFFLLTKVENEGAMLSAGSNMPETLRKLLLSYIPAAILLIGLGYIIFKPQIGLVTLIAYCFVIGGGIGNIIDRILHGSVTDFMNIGIGTLRTGIFNFADVSIMVGIAIIVINAVPFKSSDTSKEPI